MATGVVVLTGSLGSSSNSSTSGEFRRPPVTITMSSWDGGGGGSGVTVGLSFVCCFGGEGACSFFGDLIRSSLLICRLPIVIGEAGGFEIVWSGRSTPLLVLLLPAGVCGVSGGVGGTVVCAVVTPSELGGAFLLLGDEGVCGGGGAGPFSFFRTPFFSPSVLPPLLPLTLASAGSTGGNTGAGTVDVVVVVVVVGDDFLASLCTLLLLSLAAAAAVAAAADGGVVELGVVVAADGVGGDCAAGVPAAAAAAAGFALLSSSTGTGVDSFESLDDFDKDVGVSGSL